MIRNITMKLQLCILYCISYQVHAVDIDIVKFLNIDNNIIFFGKFINALQSINTSNYDGELSYKDGNSLKYNFGSKNEDVYLNVSQLISKYNHPVEEHQVETQDGYLLTLVRIPCNSSCPVVFLMHGLLLSADDYIMAGPDSGIAYVLASKGYDVWMGNARGTKYSRKHERLSPDKDKEFWDFSWHEIGIYDIPAMMDYVLKVTDQTQLVYIGHSQGTTSFYVMCSERPEYNSKVSLMISLSAVAWMSHIESPVGRAFALLADDVQALSELLGYYELLPSDIFTRIIESLLCSTPTLALTFCSNILFTLFGFDYSQQNITNLPVIYGHAPSGAAVKQFIHYLQEVNSGHFRQYDYGEEKNLVRYGTKTPPDYEVEKITAPVAIFYADNDWLSNFIDVQILIGKLAKVVHIYHVPYATFNHQDYLWGRDVNTLVNGKVLELIKQYAIAP